MRIASSWASWSPFSQVGAGGDGAAPIPDPGSIVPAIGVSPGDHVRCRYSALGEVDVRLV